MASDYEIVPEKDFDSLKSDIEKIKKDPIGNTSEGKALKESIDKLNDSINNMMNLFKMTAESLKAEDQENQTMTTKIVPLFEKVERLAEQNEKIAKGIVALAEMFEDLKSKQTQTSNSDVKKDFPPKNPYEFNPSPIQQQNRGYNSPQMQSPNMQNQMAPPSFDDFSSPFGPPSQGAQPLPRLDMPPPPQTPPKKRGLFGR